MNQSLKWLHASTDTAEITGTAWMVVNRQRYIIVYGQFHVSVVRNDGQTVFPIALQCISLIVPMHWQTIRHWCKPIILTDVPLSPSQRESRCWSCWGYCSPVDCKQMHRVSWRFRITQHLTVPRKLLVSPRPLGTWSWGWPERLVYLDGQAAEILEKSQGQPRTTWTCVMSKDRWQLSL